MCCSGVVGELCGLAYGRRQDSSVQNDADVASAEAVESFGSLSGHEGNKQKTSHPARHCFFSFLSLFISLFLSTKEIENASSVIG